MGVYKYEEGKLVRVAGNGGINSDGILAPTLPVGAIFPSALPIDDARVHLLNGETISQTGVYADFANLINELKEAGHPITCSETEFTNAFNLTGNCGKFVIDNDAGTIRLPIITRFIQGITSLTDIGKSLEAGLPNIEGQFDVIGAGNGAAYPWDNRSSTGEFTGAFKEPTTTTGKNYLQASSSTTTNSVITKYNFDASDDNEIYGNSETVQPSATQYPYYIVLAGGYKSTAAFDIDNITAELNNKISSTGTRTRPKYNNKDLALHSDLAAYGGTNLYIETYSGVTYYPLARFTRSASDTSNSSYLLISGKIGGWTGTGSANINLMLYGRGSRNGTYSYTGDIKTAFGYNDIVIYEESSTNTVVYLKASNYSNAKLTLKATSASGGIEIIYTGSTVDNPAGTKIYTMSETTPDILDRIYPVGSIYISTANNSPAKFLGGTWTQLKDTFLLAHGDTYTSTASANESQVKSEAGAASVSLSTSNMPSHTHSYTGLKGSSSDGVENTYGVDNSSFTGKGGIFVLNYVGSGNTATRTTGPQLIGSTGSGSAHNNMPPYLVVYMWKRVA